MIDIHTHVLPGIDDGSKSVEETEQMLRCMAESGVETVIATPHYYHDVEIEEFVQEFKKPVIIKTFILEDMEGIKPVSVSKTVEFK